MSKIEFQGLNFVCGCKILPPRGYSAITLFGTVYTRKSADVVFRYIQTDRGKVWAHHEAMHVYQADTFSPSFLKWFLFYVVYIYEFLKTWPFFMTWKQAYRTTCFELEAYMKQDDLTIVSSKWWEWIWCKESRKIYNFNK